jgi:CheY-like chemotaxis protein
MRRILIVDDAKEVADALALAVNRMPQTRALVLAHPSSALDLFQQPGFCVSAVITDLHLPAMDGLVLIKKLRLCAGNPGLPAILITAAAPTAAVEFEDKLSKPDIVFGKPFSIAEVCRALESLLV